MNTRRLLNNPHFWVIIAVTLFLVFIYQAWPWRYWMVDDGIWQWFPWLSSLYRLALFEAINKIVGILFLVPIIYSAAFFFWRGALVTSLLSLGGVLPIIAPMWSFRLVGQNTVMLLLPLFIVSIATFEIEWHRKERKISAEREEERRIYTSRVLDAQEEERQRIARDLHDETMQTLLAIASSIETLMSVRNNDSEIERNTALIRDTALRAADKLREISLDLRPGVLSDLGLVSAVRWLADGVNEEYGIKTLIIINSTERKLSPRIEITVFRVIQEALNNIKRHSQASEALVTFEFNAECLKVTIEDNGQGFRLPRKFARLAAEGKLGLVGMEERINSLGGTLQIRSKLGEGTILSFDVKYEFQGKNNHSNEPI
jgi:signal transduction histidine kinase